MLTRVPATPASAAPRANVMRYVRWTSMPATEAASQSSAVARTALPK